MKFFYSITVNDNIKEVICFGLNRKYSGCSSCVKPTIMYK